jgi:hypothetical protein
VNGKVRPGRPGEPAVERHADDPGRDELLAEPAGPRWFGTPQRRRVAGALVAVAAAGLVSVRLATVDRGGTAANPPQATTPPASVIVGPSPVDVTPGRPNFQLRDPAHCPSTITCRSVASVPPGVLAAIRQVAPHAAISTRTSVVQLSPKRLYFRQVNASAEDVDIVVLVSLQSRRPAPPSEGTANPLGQAVRYVRLHTPDGYVVEVQITGPPESTLRLAPVRSLARDPRLRSLG